MVKTNEFLKISYNSGTNTKISSANGILYKKKTNCTWVFEDVVRLLKKMTID